MSDSTATRNATVTTNSSPDAFDGRGQGANVDLHVPEQVGHRQRAAMMSHVNPDGTPE